LRSDALTQKIGFGAARGPVLKEPPMNITKLLTALAIAFAVFAAPVSAAEKTCCEKAKEAGKTCEHKCCVAATKEGKVCKKCNPDK
jgi:hypothetical protein